MKFYEYTQNNSGGLLITDDKVCHRLFIEEENAAEANKVATKLGVYFCDADHDGPDCRCCGDRWSEPDELEFPYRYGTFEEKDAKAIAEKHKVKYDKTTWRLMNTHKPDPNKYDIIFNDVESYARYLKGEHVYHRNVGVEIRIYYKNKTVVSL